MSPDQTALVLFHREVLLPETKSIADAAGARVLWKRLAESSEEGVR